MKVTLYRRLDGTLSFYLVGTAEDVQAELADGYRVDEGAYDGLLKVFGKPGQLGMSADAAVEEGVLVLVETK